MLKAYQSQILGTIDQLSCHLERYAIQNSFDPSEGYKNFLFFENALKILPHQLITEDEIIRAYCKYVVEVSQEDEKYSLVKQASFVVIGISESLQNWINYNWGQQKRK